MKIDIQRIPWSRRGARLAISLTDGRPVLKDIGGGDEIPSELFDLSLVSKAGENHLSFSIDASPERCIFDANGQVEFFFTSADSLAIRCQGAGLRLSYRSGRYDSAVALGDGAMELQCYLKDRKYRFSGGSVPAHAEAVKDEAGKRRIVVDLGAGEYELTEYAVVPKSREAEGRVESSVSAEWESWRSALPPALPRLEPGRDQAGYITWSCLVRPEGRLTREAMFMSKNWMTNIWSWDNCFNALALARREPALALDQLLLFADAQDPSGAYPDYVNDKYASFSCVKPTIHAWTLSRMLSREPSLAAHTELPRLYESIAASTRFFLGAMRLPGGALAWKQGNDSGWDNASIFAGGGRAESPDLYAHLARQCDELAALAPVVGRPEDSAAWIESADVLTASMLKRLVDEKGCFARGAVSGEAIPERGSLILRMPLVAWKRLPPKLVALIVSELGDESKFMSLCGPASEAMDSPLFRRDGYWLGPVWAPVTYLLACALREISGDARLEPQTRAQAADCAIRYALRFAENAARYGMAENFDPISGAGLVDPAFSWTSSVFLLFLEEYVDEIKALGNDSCGSRDKRVR